MGPRFCLLLLCGCSKPISDPATHTGSHPPIEDTGTGQATSLDLPFEDRMLLTQVLGDCDEATSVDAHQYLCSTDEGTFLQDERDGSSTLIGDFSTLAAAHTSDGTLVLALDGTLYAHDGEELTEIDTVGSIQVHQLSRQGDTLWLWGAGHLYRWTESVVSKVFLPDYTTIYGYAVTRDRLYLSVPWLVEVQMDGAALEVVATTDTIVDSMATDAHDNLWYVAESQLYLKRPDEEPRHVRLPDDIISVVGPSIWVQGAENTYRAVNNTLSQHGIGAGGRLVVDSYGRLMQLDEGHLRRHSIDRPVVVTGLSGSLFVPKTALLLPSDPETLTNLRVWLDAEALEVEADPWTVTVDPEGLEEGPHELRFFCESELGDRQDEYAIWVGELPEVTWSEIEILSQTHCLRCHGGATLTDLSTQADWERRIHAIIEEVTTDNMPLGGPYLSDDEIILIRGWKHGGFQ